MKRLLREPLLHFLVLGLGLFLLYALLNDAEEAKDEIVVDAERMAFLASRFERTWQRPPTKAELDGLVTSWIREEILYREGIAMGLDRDDPIVRRRIAQKMDFISDAGVAEPEEAALQQWLSDHADSYRVPPSYALEQRFFDPGRHGENLEAAVGVALDRLRGGAGAEAVGDATLLPQRWPLSSSDQIARTFGEDFAASLAKLPDGEWAGPVRSGYGMHLVRIGEREPGYLPELDEVRDAVARDLLQARTDSAKDALFELLRERYTVRFEEAAGIASAATPDR